MNLAQTEFVRLYCGCRTTASGLPVTHCYAHDSRQGVVSRTLYCRVCRHDTWHYTRGEAWLCCACAGIFRDS